MCGICGKFVFDRDAEVSADLIKDMADTIQHRGPDDEGFYLSGQIGLGFRRLSIIDLAGGHQPLSNEDGSVWIVFNGEIYNYQALREFLRAKGHIFRTHSDTEVIVHLYEELGEACVEHLRGMFAFAIWDSRRRSLFLARDRVGIKPLYYCLSQKTLLFASEIKAILADPDVKREVEPEMIDRLLTFNFLPGENTLLRNIHKLPPGSYMVARDEKTEIHQYWDLRVPASAITLKQAEVQLQDLLHECVDLHMISDVPVGFLLSGGFDSTALLGIASSTTDKSFASFTVGFSQAGVEDERPYASLAAHRFKTEHHEMTISSQDFANFLPKYVWFMEEPICEPPAVAMYFISKLARASVKVLISGEGGDEAFGGYPIYRNISLLERTKTLLGPLQKPLSNGLVSLNGLIRSGAIGKYAPLLGMPFENYYLSGLSNPFRFFNRNADELYSAEFAKYVDKPRSVNITKELFKKGPMSDWVNKMLYVDIKTWLAHDLLLKADKMTMANSIELRVPFLDHKLLEFAASLPGTYKVRGFTTKYLAKKALASQVPREIVKRKKAGFPVPYEYWLRNDLKEWLRDILLDTRTVQRGYFQKKCVEKLISTNGESGFYSKELFLLAVLELWHRQFLEKKGASIAPQEAVRMAQN